jgi:(4-alkanoyl-5-oxo-2,5-dihydrofuran-3-yl)methyl phosphate reductase
MILVTGATGTVGSALVRHLLAAGQAVRIFVRDPGKVGDFGDRVDVVIGDLAQPETLAAAMTGIERVFLLTFGVQQDMNVVAAARAHGVQHIVKMSTQEAGWVPVVGHGHWHREGEKFIEASGLTWTFLRPTLFMSTTLEWWAAMIRKEGKVYYSGGSGRVAPIDPDDVAAVGAAALTSRAHLNKGYELTGPELLTFGDMVHVLECALGRPLRYVDISEESQRDRYLKGGLPESVASGLAETHRLIRAGRFAYKTDIVEQVLGRPPATFEAWCRAHAAAFKP